VAKLHSRNLPHENSYGHCRVRRYVRIDNLALPMASGAVNMHNGILLIAALVILFLIFT
jgi:hypothetical protein